jgi:hypothetical protein
MTGSTRFGSLLTDTHTFTGSINATGSNTFRGTQTVTGSLFTSGSNTLVGSTTLTGSFNVTGSTTQTGNNTLIGNTVLSGSIIISGSSGPGSTTASVQIFGDIRQSGYHRFDPVTTNIDTSISASYIYVSGSTQDLYFSQNSKGYSNTTRLRWLEGNLYTGLLNGGLITATVGSTTYQISSGSGIIVNLNASLNDNPYPTIQYLNWGNLSGSISAFTSSFQQVFVGIDSTNNIFAQGAPFNNGQFDNVINIGGVFFQNGSTINAVKTQPSVAYGFEQQQNIFNRAFGPLKLSGYTLAPSGSSTLGLIVGSGTAYAPGSNYAIDPNEPSYTVDNGTNISKIFRYRQSGSNWVYDTNAGAGYTAIDPGNYSNNGVLTTVQPNDWSIQRVFWFPNSVVKAIVVYYGNASYSTEAEAIANINIESFVEAPNTAANAVYLGAIVIKGSGLLTVPADFTIVPGGLFRQVGGSGGGGSIVTQTLSGLSDVSISGPTSGQALVYDTTAAKWRNLSFISASISGNAATSTSASFATTALTASFIPTASLVGNFFAQGGNSFGTTALLGTNDTQNLALETSGSVRMFISSSGNVGINTTGSSAFILDVSGSTRITEQTTSASLYLRKNIIDNNQLEMIRMESLGSYLNYFKFLLGSSNNRGGQIVFGEIGGGFPDSGINFTLNSTSLYQGGNFPLILNTNSTARLTALGNGNVTIGTGNSTTDTGHRLLVSGSGTSGSLNVNNTLYVSGSRVGIATASPVSRLHISGLPDASGSYGTISIGGGGFNTGSFTGSFNGSASGSSIAINETSSFSGRFIDAQITGSPVFQINTSSGGAGAASTPILLVNNITNVASANVATFRNSGANSVGITLSATDRSFQIRTNGEADGGSAIGNWNINSGTPTLRLGNANNTITALSISSNPTTGNSTFTTSGSAGQIIFQNNGLITSGSLTVITGSAIEFQVTDTGVKIGNIITDVNTVTGSLNVSGSITTLGTLTAQTLVVQTITSSIIFSSGSNRFGNDLANTQTFTGSLLVTGSNHTIFGNVGVGITGSNAFRLDVSGSARIQGSTTITATSTNIPLTLNAATANNTMVLNHSGLYNAIQLNNSTSVEAGVIGWGNASAAAALQNSFYFLANRGNVASASIRFVGYNGATLENYMTIAASSGNVQIATTTDSGFKLDVSGSTRFNGNSIVTGSLTVITGSGVEFQVTDTGVKIGNAATDVNTVTGSLNISGSFTTTGTITAQTLVVQTVSSSVLYSSGSNRFGNDITNTQTFTGSVGMTGSLAVDGTARVSSDTVIGGTNSEGFRLKIENSGANILRLLRPGLLGASFTFGSSNALTISGCSVDIASGLSVGINTGAFVPSAGFVYVANGVTIGQGSTINASAVLDVASTTKGFLPPRMTAAQRTGISSPASGLIVYDTGSAATEGVWVYETTGWQQLLTNTGSQSISGSLTLTGPTILSGSLTVVTGSGVEFQVTDTGVKIGNIITDTHTVTGSLNISGSFTTTGTITAQTLVVQTVTSSVIFSSGSNRFGNDITNTQVFTGSVGITGSLAVNGTTATLGTGTVNTVPKFTSANIIGNSNITDNGSLITLGSNTTISGGALGIGSTSLTGYNLRISTNPSAATAYGIMLDGLALSSVTTSYHINRTLAQTQAASFNLPELAHYYATQGAFGAGSTVSNQYGFIVGGTLIGATNNYGFYGNINSGANRWNLYMNGTAANYLAGDTSIGTTTGGYKLNVNGTANITGNTIITGSLTVVTGSGVEFQVTDTGVKIGNIITDTHTVTGSLNISGSVNAISFTGSLIGTASWANNAATASSADNFTVRGTLTAQTIVAQTITSSTVFSSGSNRFGNDLANTQVFTGSLLATGSNHTISGNVIIGITGSSGISLDVSGSARVNGNASTLLRIGGVTGAVPQAALAVHSETDVKAVFSKVGSTDVALRLGTNGSWGDVIGNYGLTLRSTGTAGSTSDGRIQIMPFGGTTTFFFSGSGNVGLNQTTDAGFKLDVNGNTRIQSNLLVTNTITGSSALISGSGTQRLVVVGSGSAQPIFTVQGSQGELFSVTDSLSGSLFSVNDVSGLPILEVFSDSTTLVGSYLAPALNTTTRITTTNSGSFVIYSVPTASYDGIFVDYTARSGSNARAGVFTAIWSGSSVNYMDNSTTDFGNTTALSLVASISGSNMIVTGSVTAGSGWTVKAIIRSI